MHKAFLLFVVFLVFFPSNQVQAQTGSSKTQPAERNAEAQSFYEDGMKRLEMGQVSEAVERFQQALRIDPDYAEAYSALGRGLFKLGQWGSAVAPLRRAIALKAKERERQDVLKKNRLESNEPRVLPPSPAIKPQAPKSNSSDSKTPGLVAVNLNKPLPALRINSEPTFNSDLKLPNAQANIKPDLLQIDPPPEVPQIADAKPAEVAIATNVTSATNTSELIESPKTLIGVPDPATGSIVVEGLVKHPGKKSLKAEVVPLAAILAEAQPLVEATKLVIVRDGTGQVLETDPRQSTDLDFLVHPGDVIKLQPHVEEFLYIGGKVKFPGEKGYRLGLTLMQVILIAGGATDDSKVAEITREGGEPVRVDLQAIQAGKATDPLVEPGDRIILR